MSRSTVFEICSPFMLIKPIAVCGDKIYGGEMSELNLQYTIYDSVGIDLGELLERMQIAQLYKEYLSPFMPVKPIAVCDGKIHNRERSEMRNVASIYE